MPSRIAASKLDGNTSKRDTVSELDTTTKQPVRRTVDTENYITISVPVLYEKQQQQQLINQKAQLSDVKFEGFQKHILEICDLYDQKRVADKNINDAIECMERLAQEADDAASVLDAGPMIVSSDTEENKWNAPTTHLALLKHRLENSSAQPEVLIEKSNSITVAICAKRRELGVIFIRLLVDVKSREMLLRPDVVTVVFHEQWRALFRKKVKENEKAFQHHLESLINSLRETAAEATKVAGQYDTQDDLYMPYPLTDLSDW